MLDYCEQSKIVVYNWHDDTETVYNGMAGAKRCANELFAKLKDLSGLAAPMIHVEEGNPKSVFVIWRCPTSGLPRTVNGTGHTGPSEFCATSI